MAFDKNALKTIYGNSQECPIARSSECQVITLQDMSLYIVAKASLTPPRVYKVANVKNGPKRTFVA